MPPKKGAKGGGKKGKGGKKSGSSKGPTIIDGVPASEMSRDQLEGHVRRLQEELQRERDERNFYQLERDRIDTFWEVTRKELEETRAEVRVKDRELEESEERHMMEVKVYKQKVKHLLYEQENNIAELKAENMVSLKVAREEQRQQEQQHLRDKQQLTKELHEKDKQYTQLIRDGKLKQTEQIEELRSKFEEQAREMENRYQERYSDLRAELGLRARTEVSHVEERKNDQIDHIKKSHEKAFNEIKNYYNDITLNNLAMIATLKEEIKERDVKIERSEKQVATVQAENKKLAEPLKKAKEELYRLKGMLGNHEKDKNALITTKAKIKVINKELEEIRWEHEVLQQKYNQVSKERDEIQERFSTAILEIQQKAGLKYMLLEKKIMALKEELEEREAALQGASREESGIRGDILRDKNRRIRELETELMLAAKRASLAYGSGSSSGSSQSSSRSSDYS